MIGLFMHWLSYDAPRAYWRGIQDLIFGLYEFFSIRLHVTTLFAPWRHDAVALNRLPISQWGQAIGANLVSRTIGFIVRSCVVGVGLVAIFVIGLGSVIFLVSWYVLPLLLIASMVYGVMLVLKGLGV